MSSSYDAVWEAAVDAIDAYFDGEYDRCEEALLAAIGQLRKERQQRREAQ